MLRFPVPQYVNVEDKIAGPLTWKQLYWMIVMTVILMLLWRSLSLIPFIVIAIFVVTLFCSLAFYRPWGQPLLKVFWFALVFIFQPKQYMWKRISSSQTIGDKENVVHPIPSLTKEVYKEKLTTLQEYASVLDNPVTLPKENIPLLAQEKKYGIFTTFFLKNKKKK